MALVAVVHMRTGTGHSFHSKKRFSICTFVCMYSIYNLSLNISTIANSCSQYVLLVTQYCLPYCLVIVVNVI